MSVGIVVTKQQFDEYFGTTARAGKIFFERVVIGKDFLDQFTSTQLQTAGLVTATADGDLVKSAYADLAQLETIWRGAASLGTAKDFRTFARQIWGLGVTSTQT